MIKPSRSDQDQIVLNNFKKIYKIDVNEPENVIYRHYRICVFVNIIKIADSELI